MARPQTAEINLGTETSGAHLHLVESTAEATTQGSDALKEARLLAEGQAHVLHAMGIAEYGGGGPVLEPTKQELEAMGQLMVRNMSGMGE